MIFDHRRKGFGGAARFFDGACVGLDAIANGEAGAGDVFKSDDGKRNGVARLAVVLGDACGLFAAGGGGLAAISDAKAKIRKSTGQYPNVLHLDVYAYEALKRHPKIIEHFKYTGAASITTAMLATYFDIETVVVAKAVSVASLEADFTELWGNNTILAYVAPASLRSMRVPSFGYNYVLSGFRASKKATSRTATAPGITRCILPIRRSSPAAARASSSPTPPPLNKGGAR